jgi:hypothetical protein
VEARDKIRTGGCACGQLTFRTSGEPRRVGLCHCMTCRKISGSPVSAFVIFPAVQVTVEGRSDSWPDGNGSRSFCPTCGSRVFSRSDDEIEIGMGAFDEPNLFEPTYELWTIRREHWFKTDGLVAYEKNRDGGPT